MGMGRSTTEREKKRKEKEMRKEGKERKGKEEGRVGLPNRRFVEFVLLRFFFGEGDVK